MDIHSMNLASLDLNLLVALEALLEESSVGQAADRVSLSQPAMSHALKRLRVLLGDPLLVRVGARMQLTARAEAMRHPLQDALTRVRDLLIGERFEPARSTRTFRLFVADNASDLLLPLLLKRLEDEAPTVCIRIQPLVGNTWDPFELARVVDVAVACVPSRFKGFYQQRLFTDRDACVVRRGHPSARLMAKPEQFLKAKHVAVVGREFTEDPVDTWLRQEGRERNVVLTVPHYLQALHVVSESNLIGVIPERLIRAYADILGLDAVTVPLDVGTFEEYLLYPARSRDDSGCVWLRGILMEIAKSLGPLEPKTQHKMSYRRSGSKVLPGLAMTHARRTPRLQLVD
jgi:DNA-binding transcriptional LysR family regulator